MKKIFNFVMIAAIAASTLSFVSCNKDNKSGNKEEEKTPTYRMASFSNVGDDWEDKWVFTYNEDGTMKEANRGDADHHWLFTYSGNKVNVKLENGTPVYEMTLDANGNATSIKDFGEDCTYNYQYDNAGFMVKAFEGEEAITEVNIQNDCITSWTRVGEEGWRYKDHTYDTAKKNFGGIHTSYSEDAGMPRWIHEAGFLGKAPAYVCLTAQWRDRDQKAEYTYEYDNNGCVVLETKYYDSALDCAFGFTYEEVK